MAQAGLMDWLSSDTAQWAAPLALGFLSGATPGTARAARGIATGLQLVGQAQEQQKQNQQRQAAAQRLQELFATTQQAPQLETEPGDVPVGTRPVPVFSPGQQKLGEALVAADQIGPAAQYAGGILGKESKPYNVSPGGRLVSPQGQELYAAPEAQQREQWQQYTVDLGDRVETGLYNRTTGKRRSHGVTPKGAALPRQVSPQEQELKGAQIQNIQSERNLREQRIKNLQASLDKVNDPKTTAGQLSAVYNALIRDRDAIETPKEDIPVINDAIRQIRSRLAELGKTPSAQPAATPATQPPTTPPGKPIGKTRDGRVVYEAADGSRYVAN